MQPTCIKTALLSALVDNELDGKKKDELLAHVDNCLACQKELTALKAADRAVKGIPDIEPSTSFNHEFWTKIDQIDQKRADSWYSWVFNRRALVGVGLTAGLAVGLYMGGFYPKHSVPINQEDLFMAENMEFLSDYDVVEHLELLEDWDAINDMKDNT